MRLNGGETINDTTITPDGVYYLDGTSDYTQGITIDTGKDVTIRIEGTVTLSNGELRPVLDVKQVKCLTIENNAVVEANASNFLKVEETATNAVVKVNGGHYTSDEKQVMFYFAGGKAELRNVTCETGGNALNNDGGEVWIYGGSYINESDNEHPPLHNGKGKLTVSDAKVVSGGSNAAYNADGTLEIIGGSFTSKADMRPALCNENGRLIVSSAKISSEKSNAVYNLNGTAELAGDTYTSVEAPTIYTMAGAETTVHSGTFERTGSSGQAFTNYGTLTIDNDKGETKINNPTGTSAAVASNGKLYFKGGTITAPNAVAIRALRNSTNTSETVITGGTIAGSLYGISVNGPAVLENVTFENNKNDIYLDAGQKITIKDTFTDSATVKVAESSITTPRQITTSDAPNQQNLKLTSNDGYLVAYDSTGNYRYLTEKTAGKYTVTAEHATAAADLGSGEETLYSYTEVDAGTTDITLKADPAPAGEAFDGWEVLVDGTPNDALLEDNDAEETHFWMPTGSVTVRAKYKTVIDPVDPSGADNIKGALSAVVVGAAAGAILYEAGTGIYRVINMPGIILPSNRIELADLIWERAGKPEPQNTDLYDDIDEDDTDWQKAARWMVEQELMDDDIDEEKDTEKFHPYRMVTKLRVCLTWQKAKDKGLFDNTETKAE